MGKAQARSDAPAAAYDSTDVTTQRSTSASRRKVDELWWANKVSELLQSDGEDERRLAMEADEMWRLRYAAEGEEDNAARDAAPRKSPSSSDVEDQSSSRGAALRQNASISEDEDDAEL